MNNGPTLLNQSTRWLITLANSFRAVHNNIFDNCTCACFVNIHTEIRANGKLLFMRTRSPTIHGVATINSIPMHTKHKVGEGWKTLRNKLQIIMNDFL